MTDSAPAAAFLLRRPTPNPKTETPIVRRRAVLAVAAAAVGAGCAVVRKAIAPVPSVPVADASVFNSVAGLRQAYNAAHHGLRFLAYPMTFQNFTKSVLPGGAAYWLRAAPDNVPPFTNGLVALDTALRDANFTSRALLPDSLAAYAADGHQWGLPYSLDVLAVRYRTDVFAALGIRAPAGDWTLADFEGICTRVAAALAAGKVPQARSVLPPPGTTSNLQDVALWEAFALGHGGTVLAGGRFAFDGTAVKGISVLVDLFRRFGPPMPTPTAKPRQPAPVLAFAAWYGRPADRMPAPWAYVRLPRFPVRPVILTGARGTVLYHAPSQPAAPEVVGAAVDALIWLYTPQAQGILDGNGCVPILAAPAAQKAFWSARSPAAQAIGDWRNFLLFNTGWPGVRTTYLLMGQAIWSAVADPSQLPALLASAAKDANKAAATR